MIQFISNMGTEMSLPRGLVPNGSEPNRSVERALTSGPGVGFV
jgi:hypothetical protein